MPKMNIEQLSWLLLKFYFPMNFNKIKSCETMAARRIYLYQTVKYFKPQINQNQTHKMSVDTCRVK